VVMSWRLILAQSVKFLSGSGSGAQILRKKHDLEMAVARTNSERNLGSGSRK
jgi:hypothetical protein